MSNLLRIETQLADGQKLSEFLRARKWLPPVTA